MEKNEPVLDRSCCKLLRACIRYLVEPLVRDKFRLFSALPGASVVPFSIIVKVPRSFKILSALTATATGTESTYAHGFSILRTDPFLFLFCASDSELNSCGTAKISPSDAKTSTTVAQTGASASPFNYRQLSLSLTFSSTFSFLVHLSRCLSLRIIH